MKFNGWQRLGIVCSLLWMAVGAYKGTNVPIESQLDMSTYTPLCIPTGGEVSDPYRGIGTPVESSQPTAKVDPLAGIGVPVVAPNPQDLAAGARSTNHLQKKRWFAIISWVIFPVAIGWLTAYILIGSIRWIRDGFAVSKQAQPANHPTEAKQIAPGAR